jgi:glycosyltransferase involved in cell wall biosynthesis
MSQTILYDGFHLASAGGTGIATYAREVAAAARDLGYRTEAVFGVQSPVSRTTPLLSMVGLFDLAPDLPMRRMQRMVRFARTWPGAPFGLTSYRVPVGGQVVLARRLGGFENIHVGRRIFEKARAHFLRTGGLARLKVEGKVDAYHATYPLPIQVSGVPNIVTIHDLIPLRLPHASLDDKAYYYNMVRTAAHRAEHVVTVSEHSKRDIVELLGVSEAKVTNTYQTFNVPAASGLGEAEIARDVRNAFGLEPGGYFLFYGALEPKKNVGRLVEAYALSGAKRPLVIAGGLGWQYEDDLKRIDDPRFISLKRVDGDRFAIDRRVQRISYVPGDFLGSLIRGARAVLFPSLYEGFGLPVVESMSLGTPVMTSSVSSLPEIAGDAALLVDPSNVRAMSHAIEQLDRDDALATELSLKGLARSAMFTREAYMARLKDVYAKALG